MLKMTNKFFPLFFYLLTLTIFPQGKTTSAVKDIEGVLADKFFNSTTAAIEVYDLTNDRLIYSRNSKLLLHPASNQKILTSLSALHYLDSTYTFDTGLYYNGEIEDSTLVGDLYITGGGDPEFKIDDLDSLIHYIKYSGINKITGNLYGDISMFDSVYFGQGWMWDDNPYSFSPYLSPLILEKSSTKIYYSPGKIGTPANINVFPETGFFNVTNTSVTIKQDTSDFDITRDWLTNSNDIYVRGTISALTKPDSTERNIYDPNMFFLTVLKERMIKNGIEFNGSIDTLILPDSSHFIFSVKHPLDTVLYHMNKHSDNLNAEMTLRALANRYFGKRCSAEDGIKILDSLIIKVGLDPKEYRLVDGSGLSFYNLLTAELLMGVMKFTHRNNPKLFKRFLYTLPIAGNDGTLKERLIKSGCKDNLHAKTGTLSGVSSLSGIVKSRKGNNIMFVILTQNYVGKSKNARQFQDKLCDIFYERL